MGLGMFLRLCRTYQKEGGLANRGRRNDVGVSGRVRAGRVELAKNSSSFFSVWFI